MGTSPGATNVINWTNAWANTLITVNIPSIAHGTTYYFNVKAENGAGLQSAVVSSNGQTVDTTCVTTGISGLSNVLSNAILLYPNPTKDWVNIYLPFVSDIEIYNSLGMLIYEKISANNEIKN
ncbi:MAG: hypothetical protein KatS3mg027_2064 [Bacteroidia bacterium]|nr:MAG: hypothetical protein KatS3mg027_2064 [Bacteroidia bacterium]